MTIGRAASGWLSRGQSGARLLARRISILLGNAILVVFLAYTLTFLLLFLLPGDAALARIGADGATPDGQVDPAALAALRHQVGLDRPLIVIFLDGLLGLLHGDLGVSMINGRPVTELIGEALPGTIELAAFSLVFSVVIGIGIAVLATTPRPRWIRTILAGIPASYSSLPVFWVGLIGIYLFSITLGWVPAAGSRSQSAVILPGLVLALGGASQFAQVLISGLREEMSLTYASTTAPAKGASRTRVVLVHALRNASFAFLALLGMRIAWLLGGTVIVETVFSRSGIGRLMVDSVRGVDLTVVLGIVVLSAVLYVVVNLFVDVAYRILDPRTHHRPAASGGDADPLRGASKEAELKV